MDEMKNIAKTGKIELGTGIATIGLALVGGLTILKKGKDIVTTGVDKVFPVKQEVDVVKVKEEPKEEK